MAPLIEEIPIHIYAVWLGQIVRNQLLNRRQERRLLLRAIRYISQVRSRLLGWWWCWFCDGRRIIAAHQGFHVLHSGYKLLLANIGPSATLSRLGGLRVLFRVDETEELISEVEARHVG